MTVDGPPASGSAPQIQSPSLVGQILDGRYRITKKLASCPSRTSAAWPWVRARTASTMYVMGWSSYTMPMKYARGRGIARAAEAHRRLSPGDRL